MSVNKWIGIGNLTRDPELKYTPAGTAVCNFSIACNERFKTKDGEQQEKVEYVNIVAWRQLAEVCGKWLTKGKQVYVEGRLTTRKWQDRDGQDRYTTEIEITQMQMLGGKGESGSQSQQRSDRGNSGARNNQSPQDDAPFNPDDDIPF